MSYKYTYKHAEAIGFDKHCPCNLPKGSSTCLLTQIHIVNMVRGVMLGPAYFIFYLLLCIYLFVIKLFKKYYFGMA